MDGLVVQAPKEAMVGPEVSKPPELVHLETVGQPAKTAKASASGMSKVGRTGRSTQKAMQLKTCTNLKSDGAKPSQCATPKSSASASTIRRNSTGGFAEKQSVEMSKGKKTTTSVGNEKSIPSVSRSVRQSLPEMRRSSSTADGSENLEQATKKSGPISPASRTLRSSSSISASNAEPVRKPSFSQSTVSSKRKANSPSLESTGSNTGRKSVSRISSSMSSKSLSMSSGIKIGNPISSSSGRSQSTSCEFKNGSSPSSKDRGSNLSGKRKTASAEGKDSHFIVLPQVEIKAGDDVRLDLRGHRIRSLSSGGMNLSQNLEFVYLRDNLLASVEGVEILTRVKVLDLSFNEFKGPGFEPLGNCKFLQQLYLAGNQITSLSTLPELPNLEFLSVAQNKLKSLAMACQPRLQVLAASRNKISTLKGFPYLPVLEHLRLEENPILQMPHLQAASILLVGPTLKKFNDRDLSKNEVAVAKHYPAHAAICIQNGWEFCSPEHAEDSTFSFLAGRWMDQLPPGFHIKEASVDPPFVEDACRCHFIFAQDRGTESKLVLQYQWFLGDKALSSFVAIPDANSEVYSPTRKEVGKLLKVECTPILEDAKYAPIFAISTTVSPGTGCPKVLNLDVHGDLVEGSTIRGYADVAWCGGTPGKGVSSWLRRRWNSSPVVVPGAEDEDYLLTLDDVDSSLVYMYTPVTKEGTKGEPQYAITDFVIAATPSVTNVRIIGELVEDNVIRGAGDYFGGQEGPSSFEWFREDKDTGEFSLVIAGSAEYVLTKEDVGRRISFVYIPINFEGKEGEAVSVVSTVVRRAPPRVINLKVIGDMREGSKITVSGTVTGGTEGASRVQWFKSSSTSLDGEDGLEALSTSKISKAFRIPLGAVGHFIVAKFTPMTPDGDAGLPTYAISNDTVETLPPSLNFLSVTGESLEGEILTASYGYIGGHEGKSIYRWYLHEDETQPGILIEEASGLLQYHIPKGAIGRYVCFECTPVRDDGIMGEPKSCMGQDRVRAGSPRLLSLEVIGQWVEGTTLQADITYWGGDEGNSIFQWFRTSSDGQTFEIDCASHASYTLRVEDIGYFISVSCKPVRSDSACGPKIVSEQIGPIVPGQPRCQALDFSGMMVEGKRLSVLASYSGGTRGNCRYDWYRLKNNGIKERLCAQEFVDLSLEDVGCSIEIVFTPIRDDGVEGIPQSILSDVIAAGDPVGLHLSIPDCCENKEVVPRKMYFGGIEGPGQYLWFRVENKLDDSSLIATIDSHEVFICGHEQNYTPSLDDVGYYLVLHWIPIRDDGKAGLPVVAISSDPVTPAPPMVDNVRANELSMNIYSGEGEYFGGKEGSSLFSWYRETADGTLILINGANAQTYEVTVLDYNCRLLFGYTPVRSDSVVGELRLSEPTNIILPEPVQIELLAITGKTFEGEVLTAVEVIPKSDAQQHVWATYKKDVSYQWYCSTDSGDSSSFEPLPSQRSCSYRLRFEDIGRRLKCQCIVTDVFGRSSEPAYAETTQILAGIPRIDKLEIEGRGFHTNLYALKGNYSGGREGKSRIQWLRSMVGSPDLISIPGETRRMYEANVDDVGYRLVAIYTPVREDGVEGPPVSASTDPITVEPDVLTEVKKKLEVGSVKFEVLYDKDLPSKKTLGLGSIERRFLEVKRKRVKVIKPGTKTSFPSTEIRGSYAPPFHVETSRNDQHRLRIVVDSESIVDIMVHTRHLRDVIVLVIRGFAQRFNSTSLNSLLKMDAQ